MLPQLLLVLGGLLLLWLVWDRFGRRRSVPFSRVLGVLLLAGLVALGIMLLLGGKFAGVLAVLAGLWPWVSRAMRLHAVWRWLRSLRRPSPADGQVPPGGSSSSSSSAPPPPFVRGMTDEDARQILGLGPDADEQEIRAAHRRLMQANHPDHGGSTWIASRINQARDQLLRQK